MMDFKIRCSAIGGIMTKPRKKEDIVSAGSKTYCKKWLTEQIYNRKEQFTSDYIEKGNIMEDNAIDFISDYLGYDSLIKNEEYFENEHMTGTPDVITENEIIEVKNSWNCFTFPLLDDEVPNKGYYYQIQGYMYLTGIHKAKLIYTLMNTPEHLIEKQYKFSKQDTFMDFEEFSKQYIFDDIEEKYKIKVYEIEYDPEVIAEIIDRVIACRSYIDTLYEKI